MKHETCEDVGYKHASKLPHNSKKIIVHFGYDVKNDGCDKKRLLMDGHVTEIPL